MRKNVARWLERLLEYGGDKLMDGGNHIGVIKKAQVFDMTPNVERIIEAILTLVSGAKAGDYVVTQYDIVKSLFLADRSHLNRYGRPITYDNYVAMKHGPVPSFAYDVLKENVDLPLYGISAVPWTRRSAPELGRGCFAFENPERKADSDVLSPSDIKALQSALIIVKTLGFRQVRRLTHQDQAYLDAWEDDLEVRRFPMSYTLLFDSPNSEQAEAVAMLSRHL